ncbi:hypothetical protein Q9233_017319, partial [Columba guinea]
MILSTPPTRTTRGGGDFAYGASSSSPPPGKEAEGRQDQKYDPFDPTGSNPSSISRISETLAGIYDDNSLSQDFEKEPDAAPPAPPNPPGADSTLPEEEDDDDDDDEAEDDTDADLFAIKRTITVSRRQDSPEPAKREVLYDSEGLSFEGFSDREHQDGGNRGGKEARRAEGKKEKERKRGRPDEHPPPPREVKSKVAVLIREGVSSTTAAGKDGGAGGSIGVKFSRDAENRAPFLKGEEKAAGEVKGKAEPAKDAGVKVKKGKAAKVKTGLKKAKGPGGKAKGGAEARKKRKVKVKGALKKSKADSCSQGAGSPQIRLPPKAEPAWSGSEKSGGSPKPPASPRSKAPVPAATPAATPAAERELTPDSQTVDSSCKTPDAEPEADSRSEAKEDGGRPPAAPVPWNLQGGVDCATSGVLALTALLFKMEEANLASRAKAQELIQATNQYLQKLHTQERAVEEVKLAIKPFYQKKEITKDEYKDILRKAVHKDVTVVARVAGAQLPTKPAVKWFKGKWLELGIKSGARFQFREALDKDSKVTAKDKKDSCSFNIDVEAPRPNGNDNVLQAFKRTGDAKGDTAGELDFSGLLKKREVQVEEKKKKKKEEDDQFPPEIWELLKGVTKKSEYERIAFQYGITDLRGMLKRLKKIKVEPKKSE